MSLPPKYAKLAKRADELERLVCPPKQRKRTVLRAIVDGGAKAEAKEKALAEHIAAHPEDAGRTVEDFNWILRTIIDPRPNSSSSSLAPELDGRRS
jgi:hypothetical protein